MEYIVRDGHNGLIIPERNPKALAEGILRLKDDRDLLARLGENAREQFVAQFSGERSARAGMEVCHLASQMA